MLGDFSKRARLAAPVAALLAGTTACNTPARRAEKAMAICVEMEEKLFALLQKVEADELKTEPKWLDDQRLKLRQARTSMRTEASGDALVLRCASYLDDLDTIATGMAKRLMDLQEQRNLLIQSMKLQGLWAKNTSGVRGAESAHSDALRSVSKTEANLKANEAAMAAELERLEPVKAFKEELVEAKRKMLGLLPAK